MQHTSGSGQCCLVTSKSVHRCARCVQMLFSLSLCLCSGGSVCRADSKAKRCFSHGCSYSPEDGRTPDPAEAAEGYQGALAVGWGGAAVLTACSGATDSRRPVDKDSWITSDISRESCREYGGT